MEMSVARAKSNAWGNKACSHPEIVPEYDKGRRTGDSVCTQCGQDFPPPAKSPSPAPAK